MRYSTFQNLSLNPLFTWLRFPLIQSLLFQPYLRLRHLHNVLRVERNVKTCLLSDWVVITSGALHQELAHFFLAGFSWARPPCVNRAFMLKNLSHTSKPEGHNSYFLSHNYLEVKSENRKTVVKVLCCSCHAPYSLCVSLHAGRYQRGRLNSSADELPGFVRSRKFMGNNSSEVPRCHWENHFIYFSHTSLVNITYKVLSWFILPCFCYLAENRALSQLC